MYTWLPGRTTCVWGSGSKLTECGSSSKAPVAQPPRAARTTTRHALAGGRKGAAHAAVAGLVRKEALSVNAAGRLSASDTFSGITHPLEWRIYEAVRRSGDVGVRQLSPPEPLDHIRDSLEERGLLVA